MGFSYWFGVFQLAFHSLRGDMLRSLLMIFSLLLSLSFVQGSMLAVDFMGVSLVEDRLEDVPVDFYFYLRSSTSPDLDALDSVLSQVPHLDTSVIFPRSPWSPMFSASSSHGFFGLNGFVSADPLELSKLVDTGLFSVLSEKCNPV